MTPENSQYTAMGIYNPKSNQPTNLANALETTIEKESQSLNSAKKSSNFKKSVLALMTAGAIALGYGAYKTYEFFETMQAGTAFWTEVSPIGRLYKLDYKNRKKMEIEELKKTIKNYDLCMERSLSKKNIEYYQSKKDVTQKKIAELEKELALK